MFYLEPSLDDVQSLIKVSRGSEPADLYVRGGTVANVYSGEYLPANVAVKNGRIAYVGSSEESIGNDTEVIDASGKYLCPGYVEVHAHPWEIYNPVELCRATLPLGTTSIFCDILPFLVLLEDDACVKILADLAALPINAFWNPRAVPTSIMADENVRFATDRIRGILELPNVAGIFEITRWPLLLEGDPHLLETIAAAHKLGKLVDGHTAGCSYEKLNPVVAAGLDSCHEAIDARQALDRLRLGMHVFLRDSSLRQDLRELIQIVTENKVHTSRIMITTDGPSPSYFTEKGSVEYLADVVVEKGVDPMDALRMITLNPATYFHLDQFIGGIAPGRIADVVVVPRPNRFKPEVVIAGGQIVARDGNLIGDLPTINWDQYGFDRPGLPRGARIGPEHVMVRAEDAVPTFPVMDLVSTVITRRRDVRFPASAGFVDLTKSEGMLYISLLGRHGEWAANGIIKGFANNLEGLASSYSTAHQVTVLGNSGEAMAMAANRLYEIGGGIVVVENRQIIYQLPLNIGGIMTGERFDSVVDRTESLATLLRQRGYPHDDLLYTLLFLSSDLLPELRVNYAGLYEVKTHQILRPRRDIL